MIAKWEQKYVTGNGTVDSQHQQLFKLVNDLHDAMVQGKGKDVQGGALKALAKYCVEHFQMEERLMQQHGYPGYATHKRIHDDLTKKATEIIQGYESGKTVLPMTLASFLGDWVKNHIGQEDMKLVQFLHAKQPSLAGIGGANKPVR